MEDLFKKTLVSSEHFSPRNHQSYISMRAMRRAHSAPA
jgi:hypothetical protein